MCGITFVHRIDGLTANKSILKRYHKQKSRGSDGFGYIAIKKNKLKSYKRAKLESQIKTFIDKEEAETILFHHRFPTSTPNFKESAHPIKVSSIHLKYDYYLVHNGIISNADELKEKHEALGFVYNTEITKKFMTSGETYKQSCFNDSEALAIEVALMIDKGTKKIEAKGSIAFIVAKVHKSSNNLVGIYYARNYGNPLKYCKSKDLISIGSESEGEPVPADILFKLDLKSNKITEQAIEIPQYQNYYGYSGCGFNGYRDKAETTYGDEYDYDYPKGGFRKLQGQLALKASDQDVYQDQEFNREIDEKEKRWNELEDEITILSQQLDLYEENNDGTPEAENRIIELEAILDSLDDERQEIEEAITMATIEHDQ